MSGTETCSYPSCHCPFDAPADPNWCARRLPKAARPDAQALAIEIADESARTDIECKALGVASRYPHPVYDVTAQEPSTINDPDLVEAMQRDVERAVRYLDARGLLVRPFAGEPNYVSFGGRQ